MNYDKESADVPEEINIVFVLSSYEHDRHAAIDFTDSFELKDDHNDIEDD